jgi:hypothetical protein
MKKHPFANREKKTAAMLLSSLCLSVMASAQGIGLGIDGAAQEVRNIFTNVSNLVLMIGAVVGLAGGIRVFVKWNNGDQDVQKELIGWAGACIFLLLCGVTLKLFFGV